MKFFFVLMMFVVTSAIRVPPSWPQQNTHKSRTAVSETRPHVSHMQKQNKLQSAKYPDLRHPNLKKEFKASATFNDWKPIIPIQMLPKTSKVQKTPILTSAHSEEYEKRVKPMNHEAPLDIPTRPIYPGPGRWAKKGIKHRPYVPPESKETEESEEEEEEEPDGYDTFKNQGRLFQKQQQRFRNNVDHRFRFKPEEEEDYSEESESEEKGFVPIKLYTQVRRSESSHHLPRLVEDPRLREVIKDSKIQTVYSEEGYEDEAYDHAGHEKAAEEDEGSEEFDKEIERKRKRKPKRFKDSEGSGSSLHQKSLKPLKMKDNFMKSEETKTTAVKKEDEMEVVSEVKVVESPNFERKVHKVLKIFPKVYRYDQATETPLSQKRRKRFVNDFPQITVDTEFIDKIKHDLPENIKIYTKPKYPYYTDPNVDPNSPLKYAEDLDNIPKKTVDEFAFYNQAEKLQCSEIQTDVDPIPKRVKAADQDPENMEETTDVQELVKGPRLKNLGDKIDCFKVKYFGEDPLDSPFFKETTIGPVLPIFKHFPSNHDKVKIPQKKYSARISFLNNSPQKNQVKHDLHTLEDTVKQVQQPKNALRIVIEPKSAPSEKVEDQTESPISIITTPKYTIDLKPKHIYHQIELLEYLPHFTVKNATEVTEEPMKERVGKNLEEITTTTLAPVETTTVVVQPESQPLKRRRRPRPRLRLKASPIPPKPKLEIFDITQYLPKTSNILLNRIIRTSTVLPKNLKSEVHYKNEIKPSEQLNVFADVINNIKNSSRDPEQLAASSTRAIRLNALDTYRKIPVEEEIEDVSTPRPRGTVKYASYKTKEQLFEDFANRDRSKFENIELLKINKRLTTAEPYYNTRSSEDNEEDEDEDEDEEVEDATEAVLGLMPPDPTRYKTIFPKLTKSEDVKMNLFYVPGMKPPPLKQKVYLYSDFKKPRPVKRKHTFINVRRGKREAQRPAYSQVIRNRNKPIDVEDEEVEVDDSDDYVPHRPQNYHYDEKIGRIVYDKVEKTEAPEEEYIEVTEAPLPKPTRRSSATTAKYVIDGPSYVDFVKVLKSNANYTEIPDPTTTEKELKEEVTTTTAKPVSTDPPEFLSFLSKVKSNANYKEIPDKTTVKTTTTEAPEEEEEEESQVDNVKNSPGGQSSGQMLQIFDITEYLPKVKTYTPRTSIDYSKYKTIDRGASRHSLSSRYSEDEDLGNVKTTKVPVFMEKRKDDLNPVMSESKHEDVEPSTTSTTTTTTEIPSSTTKRVRTRQKGRGTRRTTTSSPVSVATTQIEERQNKPKRVFPRRRPTRIKITTQAPDSEIEESTSSKVIRRRHRSEDPETKTEKTQKRAQPRKIADVQVFQKYDQTKKHGGNYKKENEKEEEKRLSDVVHKPDAYYGDPKLPKKINQLMEGKVDEEQIKEVEKDEESEESYDYEEKAETTNKPAFVKDPDKRLYFYAPV